MGFLAPAFFAGLAALAVPVAIHLINRERKTVVEFPSLMFLQKIPYKSVRRQKLRHILLLALRCLALAILALAFTRPFFERQKLSAAALTGARERIVLLDRSYSMGFGDHWQRAQDAARAAVRDLGARDRATLVLFALDANAATPPTADKAQLERAIGAATLSAEGTRFAPPLKLAAQILQGSNLPRREVVLISDMQNAGWNRRDDVRLPAGTVLSAVDISSGDGRDLMVSQVSTDRTDDSTGARDRVRVAARVTNTGPQPQTVEATLELGGRPIEKKMVTVPAASAAQVRFASAPIPSGASRGTVSIPHDALAANDAFHFVLAPDEAVSVLIIEPGNARANQSLFLRRALAIGDRPSFRVAVKSTSALTTSDLVGRSLVVLNEVPPPGGGVGVRLRELVAAGAGLLLVPGDQTTDRWPPEWRTLLPVRLGEVVDRTSTSGGTLASLNYGHPVFEAFSAPRSGDFSTARMFRYRALAMPGDSGVDARFDDGHPALVEHVVGAGKVVVWPSTIDDYWTDIPKQAVFLPFVHALAKYAGRYADPRAWFTAGDVLDLSRHGELTSAFVSSAVAAPESMAARGVNAAADAPASGDLVLESPSGKRQRLSASGASHLAELHETGFYELRGVSTPVGSGRPIAVNVDRAESDRAHFETRELIAAVSAVPGTGDDGSAGGVSLPEEMERRQTTWWYLLLTALIFLVGETLLSNRLSRSAS